MSRVDRNRFDQRRVLASTFGEDKPVSLVRGLRFVHRDGSRGTRLHSEEVDSIPFRVEQVNTHSGIGIGRDLDRQGEVVARCIEQ